MPCGVLHLVRRCLYGCHSRPIVLQVALDSRRQDVETDDIGNCDEYHEAVDEIDDLLYIKCRSDVQSNVQTQCTNGRQERKSLRLFCVRPLSFNKLGIDKIWCQKWELNWQRSE